MNAKLALLVTLFVFAISCKPAVNQSTTSLDRKACKYFEEKIAMVQDFHNQIAGYSNELERASNFLEDLTTIKAVAAYNYKSIGNGSADDLHLWKAWFKNNKQNLYWDEIEKTVKVKINRTYVSIN